MTYCRILYIKAALLTALTVLISPLTMAASTVPPMTFKTANELMAAVGKVKLSTAELENTLAYCPARFPHLAESAKNASVEWHKNNAAVLIQTTQVNEAVIASVKQHASAFVAEKMALDMDALVNQSVQQLSDEFAAKSTKEQHYLCNRMILSIASGERDLRLQDPEETRRLMEFKQ